MKGSPLKRSGDVKEGVRGHEVANGGAKAGLRRHAAAGPRRWPVDPMRCTMVVVMFLPAFMGTEGVVYSLLAGPTALVQVLGASRGSLMGGQELAIRADQRFGTHPFCSEGVWNANMRMNITTYDFAQGGTVKLTADCPDALLLKGTPGGRDNPMHNFHDHILPFLFLVRLCGTARTTALVPYPPRWGTRAEPDVPIAMEFAADDEARFAWLPMILTATVTSVIPRGRYLANFTAAPDLQRCYRRVIELYPKYTVRQQGLCHVVQDKELQPLCEQEERNTVRVMNRALRKFVNASNDELDWEKRGITKVLLYDRTEGKVNGRIWENSLEAVEALKSIPTVVVKHVRSFEMHPLDQCKVVAEADIFVTPHGGNLANLICMRPGGGLVEVMKRCTTNEANWHASIRDALGLRHTQVACSVVDEAKRLLRVDPDYIARFVEETIADMSRTS